MTREEAITVIKGLSDNPLFSDEHKQAFNIAIHDIKQRHDWDINNLILINKNDYEPLEQESIIDKVNQARKEIENLNLNDYGDNLYQFQAKCTEILDKLIESEGT